MKRSTRVVRTAFAGALTVSPFLSSTALAGGAIGDVSSAGMMPALIRLVIALVTVLALIYLSIHVFRRLSTRRTADRTQMMQVLDVVTVGAKTRLIAVKVGKRVVVVGAGDERISNVTELPESEVLLPDDVETEVTEMPFRSRLLGLARR